MRRAPDQKERWLSPSLVVRAAILVVLGGVWSGLSHYNDSLRAAEKVVAARASLAREIRTLKLAVVEARLQLPDPGTGTPGWWKDRLAGEARRNRLELSRYEPKTTDLLVGPHKLERREIALEGTYGDLLKLLAWLETSTPRIRLEEFSFEAGSIASVRATLMVLLPIEGGGR